MIIIATSTFFVLTRAAESQVQEVRLPVVKTLPLGLPPSSIEESDPALIQYGEYLFQTPLLSRNNNVACNSCHDPSLAMSGPAPTAAVMEGPTGLRHPPALLNLYNASHFLWDGAVTKLEDQIRLPLESPKEMNIDWAAALQKLSDRPESLAFLNGRQTLNETLVVSALVAYVRSLVTGGSRFDRYYFEGDDSALSQEAQHGFEIFLRKGRCADCHVVNGHSAPLTDNNFHSIGIGFANGGYADAGREEITHLDADRGLFKTPTLRNVASRRYFMHDGSMTSLREVVEYYNRGGHVGAPNQDGRIRPLYLSAQEIEDLCAFLRSLGSPIESFRP
jgi:cytochrome c peroxidase